MGIKETLKAIENAWYTINDDGFPPYRLNDDGTPITPTQRAEYSAQTVKSYGLPINVDDYIVKANPTIAYA